MSLRFLLHPLSSREFYLPYGWLTRDIRPSLDSVGFTLLYHLVLRSLLDAIYSVIGIVFTRLNETQALKLPIYLLVRVYQPDLTPLEITQFKQ
jgi:hypothetical protein